MSENERLIGADGEFVQEFERLINLTSPVAQRLDNSVALLAESQNFREKGLLRLMGQWEGKNPQGDLAKEFVALGKGKDRIVFCANPLVTEDNILNLSYLVLCRKGFFELKFDFLKSITEAYPGGEIIDYVTSPFSSNNPPRVHTEYTSSGEQLRKLLFFHNYLRAKSPGVEMKLTHRYGYDDLVTIQNLESKIGPTTYGDRTAFKASANPISFDTAFELFQAIQDRVESECNQRLEATEALIEKNQQDTEVVRSILGEQQEEKPKRGLGRFLRK